MRTAHEVSPARRRSPGSFTAGCSPAAAALPFVLLPPSLPHNGVVSAAGTPGTRRTASGPAVACPRLEVDKFRG